MPIHDWTKVRANRFHHFHQDWTIEIARTLNRGLLPTGYLAMAEQITGGPEADVVTLSLPTPSGGFPSGTTAVLDSPPRSRLRTESDSMIYARKANRLAVRHPDGSVVAIIEVVSPGNKDSKHAIQTFARKAVNLLMEGVHLLVIDLFPPSKRDPQGIHQKIWERIRDEPFELPADKPLTVVSYSAGATIRGYIEPLAVGEVIPDTPLFLTPDRYVSCPLEATYQASWDAFPASLKEALES